MSGNLLGDATVYTLYLKPCKRCNHARRQHTGDNRCEVEGCKCPKFLE
jgi:hypothetical protein